MKTFLNEQIHDDDMEDKEAHGMTFYRGQEKGGKGNRNGLYATTDKEWAGTF
jgi:hypothetical protein